MLDQSLTECLKKCPEPSAEKQQMTHAIAIFIAVNGEIGESLSLYNRLHILSQSLSI